MYKAFNKKYFLLIVITLFLFFFNYPFDYSKILKNNIELFTNNYDIINYHNINQNQKNNMLISLKDYTNNPTFMLYWGEYNDLYVMLNNDIFYGIIGIKYKYDKYIIYNLYVDQKHRNYGYGKILLNFICKVIKKKYYQENAYLYCDNDMLPFYYKLNWKLNYYDQNEDKNLMIKNISLF